MKLNHTEENKYYLIIRAEGTGNFQNRAKSIGLVKGTRMKVVRNQKKMPVLVYLRDTLLAVNRKDASEVEVEEAE